jgi:hypothetical protein
MRDISFVVARIRTKAFFKQAVPEGQVGDAFREAAGFAARLGVTVVAAEAVQHDPDFVVGSEVAASHAGYPSPPPQQVSLA